MFDSIHDFSSKLAATGYFIDPVMTQVVFLGAKLQKPLLLEGPAGSGNDELQMPKFVIAADAHCSDFVRGLELSSAFEKWNHSRQKMNRAPNWN
jgi:hypothetical protein